MKEFKIPRERTPDSTLALLRDPYRFISQRCQAHGSDLFETRLRLQKTICMTGKHAAEIFYDNERVVRSGAAPGFLKKTLFGEGGVQALDGQEHRERKSLFMELVSPERVAELGRLASLGLEAAARDWEDQDVEGSILPALPRSGIVLGKPRLKSGTAHSQHG